MGYSGYPQFKCCRPASAPWKINLIRIRPTQIFQNINCHAADQAVRLNFTVLITNLSGTIWMCTKKAETLRTSLFFFFYLCSRQETKTMFLAEGFDFKSCNCYIYVTTCFVTKDNKLWTKQIKKYSWSYVESIHLNPAVIYIGKQLHRFLEQILGRELYPARFEFNS